MSKVSLNVIALEAGVSKTTASMVLNGKGDQHKINAATQERVKTIAQKLNYRPNQLARSFSQGKTMTIGLIVPNIADSYYSSIALYLEQKLAKSSYQLIIGSTHEDPQKEKDLLLSFIDRRTDGILIASTQKNKTDIEQVQKGGTPVLLFDRHYPNSSLPYVIVDNYHGIKILVDHLFKQGKRAIGYVGLDLDLDAIHERQRGYRENYCDRFNMQTDYIRLINYDNYAQECSIAVKELISQRVSAIIFETHYLTLHGIKALTEEHVRYPEQVCIASYGDHEVFSIFSPYITALEQPARLIAEECAAKILDMIDTKSIHQSVEIKLKPQLIIRNS
ncbi:LacI family transcriptional regulator [Marinilabiliaceae bacterium JC017]|nr:LacI family transcriptional regulator [Marinilabiliaceae bacterium JC017]